MRLIDRLKPYISNLILIWLAVYIYRHVSYYSGFLSQQTQEIIFYFAISYTFFGFLFYIFMPSDRIPQSKGLILFRALNRVLGRFPKSRFEKHEKVALLFIIVKFFFFPIMLNFFLNNYFAVKNSVNGLPNLASFFSIGVFNSLSYPFLLSLIFMIDTLWFCFGYAFEAGILKNTVRSVEPTFIGWIVTLICYPPFNSFYGKHIEWYANDYIDFSTSTITFIARIFIILLLIVYVSATLALGTKCSNLTNRGIVSRGPYRFIRHPAYTGKVLSWWITLIPVMNIFAFLSMFSWSCIYYLRAITEERHLIQDPEYVEYCKRVKYKFIPRIV